MTTQNLRLIAAQMITRVVNGSSLSDQLTLPLTNLADPRDRALIKAICQGVCRYYFRLDILLSQLLKKPMRARDADVHALIMVGLYQLLEMRIPPHAAVAETVTAAKALKKPWSVGFINALLREFLRHQSELLTKTMADPEAYYAHPNWMIEKIKKIWPDHWQQILIANNEHPPFTLRINLQKTNSPAYLAALKEQGLAFSLNPIVATGVQVLEAVPVAALPGFAEGLVSVQDGAAQLCAGLMDLKAGQRVLDAAAAPGGKLTHLLECEPQLHAVAVEKEAARMPSIQENLQRLQLNATCICADAADTKAWWNGEQFDRILLDAPCSASGVIRRHPDIKLLREPADFVQLAKAQYRLLTNLWPLLAEDGLFIYATCSIFPEENQLILIDFLATHADAREEKIVADWGIACEVGRQILPGMHGMDGFYYARLRKQSR